MKVKERNLKKVKDRWYFDFSKDGKRYIRLGGWTKEEARAAMWALKAEIKDKPLDSPAEVEDPFFKDFAKDYIEIYAKPEKRSWQRDELSIAHLNGTFGRHHLSEITPLQIQKYRLERLTKVKLATVNRELACLKTILAKAIEWQKLEAFPLRNIEIDLSKEEPRERTLSADEEIRLLATAAPHLKPLIVLALQTGMRRGEILKLERRHINFTTRMITIPKENSKSKKERRVPMNEVVLDLLKPFASTAGFIFGNAKGEALKTIQESFNTACRRAKKDPEDPKDQGITGLHFHDLRHTFASRFIAAGGNVVILSKILGHSTIALTYNRYCHPSDGDMLAGVDALAEKPVQLERIDERMPAVQTVIHSKRDH